MAELADALDLGSISEFKALLSIVAQESVRVRNYNPLAILIRSSFRNTDAPKSNQLTPELTPKKLQMPWVTAS